jgi:hypothetical protein
MVVNVKIVNADDKILVSKSLLFLQILYAVVSLFSPVFETKAPKAFYFDIVFYSR